MATTKRRSHQHTHFKRRAAQRYNMTVNDKDIEAAIRRIQKGQSEPVKTLSNRVTNHRVLVTGFDLVEMERAEKIMIVGYDSKRKALTTALFPEDGDFEELDT